MPLTKKKLVAFFIRLTGYIRNIVFFGVVRFINGLKISSIYIIKDD